MRARTKISRACVWVCIARLVVLSGCDSSDGGGGGTTPAAAPLLTNGIFTVCDLHTEKRGLTWHAVSGAFDCDIDGVDTIFVDRDRDGVFETKRRFDPFGFEIREP